MAVYNFKKETKVYIVHSGYKYTLDVYPDLSFSQTFNETTVPVKTLHSQYDMFEGASITKANPANFNFTVPILYEADLNVLFNVLLDYDGTSTEATVKTADLYFEANSEIYKIEKCVIESGVFQLQKTSVITLNLSGTGRKLSKFTGTIPGFVVARSSSRTFSRITSLKVSLNSTVQSYITSLSVEVRNNVDWVDYGTLQDSLSVTEASATMWPEAFVVSNRSVSGNVQQYITDETRANVQQWSTGSSLTIEVGELGKNPVLKFIIPSAVYTNRLDIQDIYVQSYDFRMTSNPASLSSVVVKGA